MSEKKISLEEIINKCNILNFTYTSKNCLNIEVKKAMLEFGKQLLELAAENAEVEEFYRGESYKIADRFYDNDDSYIVTNKQSILDTINQVE